MTVHLDFAMVLSPGRKEGTKERRKEGFYSCMNVELIPNWIPTLITRIQFHIVYLDLYGAIEVRDRNIIL